MKRQGTTSVVPLVASKRCWALQAAEKGLNLREIREKHPAGAKAHSLFCCIYGTTKVVP
jgi:hypothetical protein